MSDGPFFFCDKCIVGRSFFLGGGDKCNVGRSVFFLFAVGAMSGAPFWEARVVVAREYPVFLFLRIVVASNCCAVLSRVACTPQADGRATQPSSTQQQSSK